jgi:alginate O-acetyltransferase complex protein AlgI
MGAGRALLVVAVALITLFVATKTTPLLTAISATWRALTGRDPALAAPNDLAWIGFSYAAFRILHTLRDRQTGILPALSLPQYVTYVLFFPSFIAGPIDRADRFQRDWEALPTMPRWDANRFGEGALRVAVGVFKKFVIADTLALGVALNATNASQVTDGVALWVLLYGYSLRLFFDFSGYSDIAIGIGIWFGVRLPENFKQPYLQTDITRFWQSWHMTLSDWARFYVFSPLTRSLLRRKPKPPTWTVVLAGQLATMVTIGLWHGVTWNFLIWGLWHGLGLFVHKQYTDRTRPFYRRLREQGGWRWWLAEGGAWLLTFHFVVLGWVWFTLPTIGMAWGVFVRLLGGG